MEYKTTAKYSKASFERHGSASSFHRYNTAGRYSTGALSKPMTAVRAAGYSSRRSTDSSATFELPKEDTLEQKVKNCEKKIMTLLEESVMAAHVKKSKIALKRAEEAMSQAHSLINFEDQVNLNDDHIFRLTFAVVYNLAQQYENKKLYEKAILEYKKIINNKNFSDSARLKVNIGNIYVKMGNLTRAMKMYQMALDQTPLIHKYTRRKIVHNTGIILIQMGKLDEAVEKFEWIMKEIPDFESGIQLILCHYTLLRVDGMKKAFLELLDVPLPINSDNNYDFITNYITVNIFNDTIKNDELSKLEHELKTKAIKTILSVTNLIAPVIEETLAQGFAWCMEAIKYSAYSSLAANIETNKALMLLHNGQVQAAIETLKHFEHQNVDGNSFVSTVLSFINFLHKDYEAAEKNAEIAKSMNNSNIAANVNLSACFIMKNELLGAENLLLSALKHNPNHAQGLYNLGLVYKKKEMLKEAYECFSKLNQIAQNDPLTLYHMGHICQLGGDIEQADKWYNQLLALKLVDPGVLKKLGEMYDSISDKQRAYHYYTESYRAYPANFEVIYWLRSYCMSMKNFIGAQEYSLKGVELAPDQPLWRLLFAECLRKSGDINEALKEYRDIYQKFPHNISCLKSLYELAHNLGFKDAKKYSYELKKLLQLHGNGDEVESRKTRSSRSNSIMPLALRNNSASEKSTSLGDNEENYSCHSDSRLNSSHLSMASNVYDTNYTNSFQVLTTRPMTAAGKRDNDFGDEVLGDDLLPE